MSNVWSAMENPQKPQQPRRRVEFSGGATESVPEASPADAAPIDPHWAELSALVSRAESNRVEMSRLQAERAEICADALDLVAVRVAQREADRSGRYRNERLGDTIPLREVVAELSAALRVGERTISTWLGDGAALVGTYPTTLQALREGRIDERHASAIIDAGIPLTPENRAEYESLILPVAETDTAPGTRVMARIIAARLQPDIVEENQRRALAERRVRAFDLDDGLARLLLDGPTALIHGIYDRVTAMATTQADIDAAAAAAAADAPDADAPSADALRAGVPGASDPDLHDQSAPGAVGGALGAVASDTSDAPDTRTLDQRRADIMTDLLLTAAPAIGDPGLGAIRATVQVTIPILTLAGLDDDPALLDGEAPIDAGTARALAASSPCWQRVMIHPITHEPLRLDTYRPSKRLRRLIGARDQHCRWPGCRRRARKCDIDHTIPWEDGGPTCRDNLDAFCPYHHTLKHASPWTVIQLGGGTLEFTSPTRRKYRNNAPPVVSATAARPKWARYLHAPIDPNDPPPF